MRVTLAEFRLTIVGGEWACQRVSSVIAGTLAACWLVFLSITVAVMMLSCSACRGAGCPWHTK